MWRARPVRQTTPALRGELFDLWLATGAVDLHAHEPSLGDATSSRPLACPVARWHATHGGPVTNRWHQEVRLDGAPLRAVLAVLDGTRTMRRRRPRGRMHAGGRARERRGDRGRRAARTPEPIYQLSPNGLASTSNDHADGGCRVSQNAVSATSSGLMKKESGLSGMRLRVPLEVHHAVDDDERHVDARRPERPRHRLGERSLRRLGGRERRRARDAAARGRGPTKTMLPFFFAFIGPMTCLDTRNAPSVFTRHDASKSAALTSSIVPHTPEPAL